METIDNKDIIINNEELKALVTFLERTKDGQYSEIEKSSLIYSRLNEEPETIDTEENYFLSIS